VLVAIALAMLSGCPKTGGTPSPPPPAAQAPAAPEPIAASPTLSTPTIQTSLPAAPQVTFPTPSLPDPAMAPPAQVSAPSPAPMRVEPLPALQPPPQAAPVAETLLDPALPHDAELIQGRLAELGLYRGAVDGKWGARSRAALKTFKARSGLPDTETWDRGTQAVLFRGVDPGRPMAVGTAVSEVSNLLDPTVARDAERIQSRLAELGLYKGAIDGKWGARSRAALKSFKQKSGLGDSDAWDKETQIRLFP
jgi:peptidoglycan hydrolase-like protein with peptidoglycan-binding domain